MRCWRKNSSYISNIYWFILHLKIPLETMSTAESEDMDMEESAPLDPHAGLRKELEALVKDSQVLNNNKLQLS